MLETLGVEIAEIIGKVYPHLVEPLNRAITIEDSNAELKESVFAMTHALTRGLPFSFLVPRVDKVGQGHILFGDVLEDRVVHAMFLIRPHDVEAEKFQFACVQFGYRIFFDRAKESEWFDSRTLELKQPDEEQMAILIQAYDPEFLRVKTDHMAHLKAMARLITETAGGPITRKDVFPEESIH